VPNGEISRYLFQSIHPGSALTALAPAGRFVPPIQLQPDYDIYLITAGSGITPIFSLLKHFVKFRTDTPVKLIAQNRTENDFIFSDVISALAAEHPANLKLFTYFSAPSGNRIPERINNEKLEQIVNTESIAAGRKAMFYICGPLSFMRMVLFTLKVMGVVNNNIKREIFDVPPAGRPSFDIDPSSRSIKIIDQKKEFNFKVTYPQTILDAALQQKIILPYSCRAGICGSCVMKCNEGSVHMKHNEVLTDDEVRNGLILSCVSYALTDITLSTS
jgi:ring-1,2-phenylacetyl-CoA epoxidase subunit PaaE